MELGHVTHAHRKWGSRWKLLALQSFHLALIISYLHLLIFSQSHFRNKLFWIQVTQTVMSNQSLPMGKASVSSACTDDFYLYVLLQRWFPVFTRDPLSTVGGRWGGEASLFMSFAMQLCLMVFSENFYGCRFAWCCFALGIWKKRRYYCKNGIIWNCLLFMGNTYCPVVPLLVIRLLVAAHWVSKEMGATDMDMAKL